MHCSQFTTDSGFRESFCTVTTGSADTFAEAIRLAQERYTRGLADAGLSDASLVFCRVYLSDIANQASAFRASALFEKLRCGAVSLIGQGGAADGRICLLTYHVSAADAKAAPRRNVVESGDANSLVELHMSKYALYYNAGVRGTVPPDSYRQTAEIFGTITSSLTERGLSLLGDALRTWIYVRDIDNNYKGMVKARREFFEANGLNETTRYLASTGIEGCSEQFGQLVAVDALAIAGLDPRQIIRMDALSYMPRTMDYGVTFERGLKVRFGDRSHLHISGTASIDPQGNIMHPGDVRLQTGRTLDNLTGLLQSHTADIGDMMYLLVYVRDVRDEPVVRGVLEERIGRSIPLLFLHAPVCRPGWLVELEGVGIADDRAPFEPFT